LDNLNEMGDPYVHKVKHIYRYEGNSDPGDSAGVYGIESTSGKKEVFVAGFSVKTNSEAARVLDKICIEGSGQCKI
jgi:hypothetical protein